MYGGKVKDHLDNSMPGSAGSLNKPRVILLGKDLPGFGVMSRY